MNSSERRTAGLLVLVCAAAVALILPPLLDRGEKGTGLRAPLPAPPAAGSCLDDAAGSGPPSWELGELSEVSCDEPHTFEVAKSWALDDPLQLPTLGLPAGMADDGCWSAVNTYMGDGLNYRYRDWFQPLINPTSRLLQAPTTQQINGRGWTACLAGAPDGQRYVGTVGELDQLRDRPSAFGLCRLGPVPVNCLQPHDEEVFGLSSGFVPINLSVGSTVSDQLLTPTELESQCHEMISELLQRRGSAWDPLILHLEVSRDGDQFAKPDSSGAPVEGYLNYAECTMRTPAGQLLSDSLVGIGDKPLPIQ